MVSAKSLIFATALATAAVAAPAAAPAPAPAPAILEDRDYEELAIRAIEAYTAEALNERALTDIIGSLASVVGIVINLLVGTLDTITTPDSVSAAEKLAAILGNLTASLNSLTAVLEDLPIIGPLVKLLAPILLSPVVDSLSSTLTKILTLLVDDVDKAVLSPLLQALSPLLGEVNNVLHTLDVGVPILSSKISPVLDLAEEVKGKVQSLQASA